MSTKVIYSDILFGTKTQLMAARLLMNNKALYNGLDIKAASCNIPIRNNGKDAKELGTYRVIYSRREGFLDIDVKITEDTGFPDLTLYMNDGTEKTAEVKTRRPNQKNLSYNTSIASEIFQYKENSINKINISEYVSLPIDYYIWLDSSSIFLDTKGKGTVEGITYNNSHLIILDNALMRDIAISAYYKLKESDNTLGYGLITKKQKDNVEKTLSEISPAIKDGSLCNKYGISINNVSDYYQGRTFRFNLKTAEKYSSDSIIMHKEIKADKMFDIYKQANDAIMDALLAYTKAADRFLVKKGFNSYYTDIYFQAKAKKIEALQYC